MDRICALWVEVSFVPFIVTRPGFCEALSEFSRAIFHGKIAELASIRTDIEHTVNAVDIRYFLKCLPATNSPSSESDTGVSPRRRRTELAPCLRLVVSGIGYLSCKTGRVAHLNDSVLVCSPFALTPGLSSKLSIAAVSPDFAQ